MSPKPPAKILKPSKKSPAKILRPSQKPPILLVHGFRGSPIGLQAIGAELEARGYQVFIPPIAPFGGSKQPTKYTPETYTEYLSHFAKDHRLQKPILVGHSMGSIIVMAAISLHPEFFNSQAILLSPISERPAAPFRLISPLSGLLPSKVVDYVTTKFLFVPHDKTLFQETLAITHACSTDHPPRKSAVFNAAKFSTKYAVSSFTPSRTAKILLLAGAKDRLVPKSQTLALAKKLSASAAKVETKFLEGTGHLHNYEQPHATSAAIAEFIG